MLVEDLHWLVYNLAMSMTWAAQLRQLRREAALTQEWAEKVVALAAEQEFAAWKVWSILFRAWALVNQGITGDEIDQMRQGLEIWQTTGAKAALPPMLTLLADSQRTLGRAADGLGSVSAAFAAMAKPESVFSNPSCTESRRVVVARTRSRTGRRSGALFPHGDRDSTPPAGKIIRVACFNQPQQALARPGEKATSPRLT
jgi:hypothetical protein